MPRGRKVSDMERLRRDTAILNSSSYNEAAKKLGMCRNTVKTYGRMFNVKPQLKNSIRHSNNQVPMEQSLTPEQCKTMRSRLKRIVTLVNSGFTVESALRCVRNESGGIVRWRSA
jgi:transposase